MTTTDIAPEVSTNLASKANRHLWGHFARHGAGITPPIITRGEGVNIWDDKGKSYIDGLSGLFVVQVGHGRKELAEAAAKQAETLSFFPLWSYATPPAIELSERLANYAPGDLNRVFFTPMIVPYGTDSNRFRAMGVKSYGFTPAILPAEVVASMHGDAEYLPVAALGQAA